MKPYHDDFNENDRYFLNVQQDGAQHRFYFSTEERSVNPPGFAVWNERVNDEDRLEMNTKFALTVEAAERLALRRAEKFSQKKPPRTYHVVLVEKAEFAESTIKTEHRMLRRWVLAQGIGQSDFVITPYPLYYRLSFRSMNLQVENAILYLKMTGVLLQLDGGEFTVESDGRLEDLRGYKA